VISRFNGLWSRPAKTEATIVYNASGGPAAFDDHAGWRHARRAKRLNERLGREAREEDDWRLLRGGAA